MNDEISNELQILNASKAIEGIADEDTFNMLLEMYDQSLMPALTNLEKAMNDFNYKEIRMQSHSIKGPSSYIGGERVKRAAEIVQFNVDKQQGPNIFKNYPMLIEESIKLRREIRRYSCLKNINGAPPEFKESEDDLKIPLCKHYKFTNKSAENPKIIQIGNIDFPPVPFLDITSKKPTIELKKENANNKNTVEVKKENTTEQNQNNGQLQQKPEEKKTASGIQGSDTKCKISDGKDKKEEPPAKKENIPEKKQEEKAKETKPGENPKENDDKGKGGNKDKKEETTSCSCLLL